MTSVILDDRFDAPSCKECGFQSYDTKLLEHHDCYIQQNGGRCEDYPCCGHEMGDCNGLKYGSDESIMEQVERAMYDEEFAYRMERQQEYDDYWN